MNIFFTSIQHQLHLNNSFCVLQFDALFSTCYQGVDNLKQKTIKSSSIQILESEIYQKFKSAHSLFSTFSSLNSEIFE